MVLECRVGPHPFGIWHASNALPKCLHGHAFQTTRMELSGFVCFVAAINMCCGVLQTRAERFGLKK